METVRIVMPSIDIREIIPGEAGQKVWDAVKMYRLGNPMSDEEKDAVCMLLVPYLAKCAQFLDDYYDLCESKLISGKKNEAAVAYFAKKYGIPVSGIEERYSRVHLEEIALSKPLIILWDAYGKVPPQKYFQLADEEKLRLGLAFMECSDAEREALLAQYDVRPIIPGPDGEKVWDVVLRKAQRKPVSAEEMSAVEELMIPANAVLRRRWNDYYSMCMDDENKVIRQDGVEAYARKYGIDVSEVEAFLDVQSDKKDIIRNVVRMFWSDDEDIDAFVKHMKKFRVEK